MKAPSLSWRTKFFNTSLVRRVQTNLARVLQDNSNLARILQVDINLARILQETCQVNALTCKILQKYIPGSCKICIFPQPGYPFNIWHVYQIPGNGSTGTDPGEVVRRGKPVCGCWGRRGVDCPHIQQHRGHFLDTFLRHSCFHCCQYLRGHLAQVHREKVTL